MIAPATAVIEKVPALGNGTLNAIVPFAPVVTVVWVLPFSTMFTATFPMLLPLASSETRLNDTLPPVVMDVVVCAESSKEARFGVVTAELRDNK